MLKVERTAAGGAVWIGTETYSPGSARVIAERIIRAADAAELEAQRREAQKKIEEEAQRRREAQKTRLDPGKHYRGIELGGETSIFYVEREDKVWRISSPHHNRATWASTRYWETRVGDRLQCIIRWDPVWTNVGTAL